MTLKTRRLIYLTFSLIFILTAPVLLLYTAGFRWNYYKNQIDKIGNLVVRTYPRRVTLTLNDQIMEKTTPWRFNDLLPNRYHLTVSKDGFFSWSKNLIVTSGETTFAEHIYLFRQSAPIEKINSDVGYWYYNKKLGNIFFQTDSYFWLQLLNENEPQKLSPLTSPITTDQWNAEENSALFGTEDGSYYLWRWAEPERLIRLQPTTIDPISRCAWDGAAGDIILCLSQDSLWQVNPFTQVPTLRLSDTDGKILDFYDAGGTLYVLQQSNLDSNVYLKILTQNPGTAKSPDYLLPASPNYDFIRVKDNLATILDSQNQKLYVLDLLTEEKKFNQASRIFPEVEQAFYGPNDELVFYNRWEVWLLRNDKTYLITRQSDGINEVLWYPSNNHLLLVMDTGLEMIELDERDQRNRAKVLEQNGIKNAALDESGTTVYLDMTTGTSTGDLFKQEILPKETGFELPSLRP